ncbi:SDR family NAD(P)-dependent oxidoreductase [Cellulomonas sp. URHB0016]
MSHESGPDAPRVLVTGTSSGLGLAVARRLVADGYAVVGVSRREVDPAQVGETYDHVRADLSDLDGLPTLVRRLVEQFGVPYALVNNAAGAVDGLLPMMPDQRIRSALDLDLVSPVLLAKHVVRPMISERRGRIVNVTSIVASTGFRGLSVYSAAKAGLEGFSRSLARDVGGRGVTVNCVAPGFLDTAMTETIGDRNLERIRARSPLGRFVTLDEVAGAVAYYLSDVAAGVTGTVLTVDAGSTA